MPLRFAPGGEAPAEIARLRIVAGEDTIRTQLIRRLAQRLSITAVEIVALTLFVILFLSRYLTRHLQAIARYVEALEFGRDPGDLRLDRAPPPGGADELDTVVASINQTRRKLAGLYAGELARSETARRHLDYALTHMTEGLTLIDAEGVVLLASPRLNELYGADAATPWAEGLTLATIDTDLVQQGIISEEMALASDPDTRLLERRLRDGRWVLMRERTLPGGRKLQLHADLTLLKRRELELRRSNADLEQFAYVASHDLQEPLRMVTGYLQLLERRYRDKLDDSAREFIAIAVDGAKRMQQLILDLLTFSRVSTRGHPYAPADMEQALADVLSSLEATVQEHAATVSHQPLPTVRADPAQMRMLLQNLVSNAVRFHRPDEQPQVNIATERLDNAHRAPLDGLLSGWVFSVRDNGIGIDPRFFERIFVIFQRLHTREEYPGTGIGLAVCKKIVERHGGRIWVESTPDRGTCFYFFLPDNPPMLDAAPPSNASHGVPNPEPP
ncbi:MAG: hypothetical protein IPM89_10780 [Candidatus Competibacteraceae bacterium]|nr:MAG: hypothetical protein IPM89_10780 [Candidatus Competibacteraceae bacterium]